jgi:hypothetical protein
MESKFASAHANQEAIGVVMAAKYASANVETVGSNIIAVIVINRSLLLYLNPVDVFSWRQALLALIRAPFECREVG